MFIVVSRTGNTIRTPVLYIHVLAHALITIYVMPIYGYVCLCVIIMIRINMVSIIQLYFYFKAYHSYSLKLFYIFRM